MTMEAFKEVTVEWRGHCEALVTRIWELFNDQVYVDVSLECHQKGFKVHRLILAVFFPQLWKNLNAGVENVCLDHLTEDRQHDVLRHLVEFAYSGRMTLPESSLESVLKAADLVGFEGLAQSIRAYDITKSSSSLVQVPEDNPSKVSKRNTSKKIPVKLVKSSKTPRRQCKNDTILHQKRRRNNKNLETTHVQQISSVEEEKKSEDIVDGKTKDWKRTLRPPKPTTCKATDTADENTTLKCDQCKYTTTSRFRFEAHCSKHDLVAKQYQCKQCPKVFRSNRGYRDHLVSHTPELQHRCTYCSFITNQKWSFRHHLAVKHLVDEHGSPVAKQFQCSECLFSCVTNRQLRAHILLKHPKNPLKCNFCDYAHPRPHRVKEHMAVMHGIDDKGNSMARSLRCTECEHTCFTRNQMADHMLRRHAPDKMQMCEECGYATAIKGELQRHITRVHRGECRYMCDICGLRVKAHSGLKRHKRSHLGLKPFECTVCGKAFADRHNLKAHSDKHAKKIKAAAALQQEQPFTVAHGSDKLVKSQVEGTSKFTEVASETNFPGGTFDSPNVPRPQSQPVDGFDDDVVTTVASNANHCQTDNGIVSCHSGGIYQEL